MQIRIVMIVDDGSPIDLLCIERGELQAGSVGLSRAEAKSLLAAGQKSMIDAQALAHVRSRRCEKCNAPLRTKDHKTIVLRTLYGKVGVDSPRLYRCACTTSGASKRTSFSPLAELLPERTLPEFQYVQAKWASLISYGMTVDLLDEVLPIGTDLSKQAVRDNVARIVRRLDAELGEEHAGRAQSDIVAAGAENAPCSTPPLLVSIDSGYVRGRTGSVGKEGCFEVIVGKSVPGEGSVKCFGFVQRIEEKPQQRLQDVLDSQGYRANRPIVFLSDGADTVRNLQRDMSPNAQHVLDWFHVTMRVTVMKNLISGLRNRLRKKKRRASHLGNLLERVKWNVWHGKVGRALERAEQLREKLKPFRASDNARKLRWKLRKFVGYIDANRAFIPNYGERYRAGEAISTALAESTVDQIISRRFVKKQQMRWTDRGCHNVLQIRTRVVNDELCSRMQQWYPDSQIAA
jgi:hypothetical protein